MADAPAHASTTFVVNSQDDQVDTNEFDGVCDADLAAAGNQCTLRAAIQQANRTSGADTINFNIPQGGISLFLTTPMPGITDTVTIDGYTQPTSSRNTLATGTNAVTRVELFGSNLSGGNGLSIEANNSVIRGLTIDDFGSDGIVVKGNGNRIEGSFIGTEPQGPADMGNGQNGVAILSGSNNTIGGTSPAARNNISANDTNGVQISGGGAGNKVLGNLIGTFKDGTSVLGNSGFGVLVIGSTNNAIGDGTAAGANTIAFNGRDGVSIHGNQDTGNRISRNSIFSNAGLGIELNGAPSANNDPGDADFGANNLQNFPVITSAKNTSTTTIQGKLGSKPNKTFTVQFFSNSSGTNEGRKFIGSKSVTTDASGNASFAFKSASKVATGRTITATATDASGNTSEFSAPKTVALSTGSALSPETTKLSGPSGVTKNPTAHFKFTSPHPQATFECSLDGGAYYEGSSPENVNRLLDGRHTFMVRALDLEGTADPTPAEWVWAVERNK